jgi:small subunit ribosomal protein S9
MTPTKKTTPKAEGEEKPKKAPAKKAAAPKAHAEKKHVAPKAHVPAVVAPAAVEAVGATNAEAFGGEMKAMAEGEFIYAIGRRKSATAKTKLWTGGKGTITVNGRDFKAYFPVYDLQEAIIDALRTVGQDGKVKIEIETMGGGQRGQAEAARLGISRALIELNPAYRKSLKKLGYLMRDPREKERKKYGLKKARKAPQWAKR